MAQALRPDLHWCRCGDRLVFLDLAGDRYFRLPPASERAFLRAIDGRAAPGDADLLDPLIRRNLISVGPGGTRPPALAPPCGDVPVAPGVKAKVGDLAGAALAHLHASILLRRGALARVVAKAVQPAAPTRTGDIARLHSILAAFRALGLVVSTNDRCLARAVALSLACRRAGFSPRLVFGVRLDPFRAHCWLEQDGLVLTGDHEEARLFTPIMAAG